MHRLFQEDLCIAFADLKPKHKFIITPQSETYGIQENIIVTSITQFLKEQLPDIK